MEIFALAIYVYLCPSDSLSPSLSTFSSPSSSRTESAIWNVNDACSPDTDVENDVENGNGIWIFSVCSMGILISCPFACCSMEIWNGTFACNDLESLSDFACGHVTLFPVQAPRSAF